MTRVNKAALTKLQNANVRAMDKALSLLKKHPELKTDLYYIIEQLDAIEHYGYSLAGIKSNEIDLLREEMQ